MPPRSGYADQGVGGGRSAFVSGKLKQNTIKSTIISDEHGAVLWCGAHRPGRMHDATAARTEGVDALLSAYPQVTVLVDAGYQGLAKTHPRQVIAPLVKIRPGALPAYHEAREQQRKDQASRRICVEHAIASLASDRAVMS